MELVFLHFFYGKRIRLIVRMSLGNFSEGLLLSLFLERNGTGKNKVSFLLCLMTVSRKVWLAKPHGFLVSIVNCQKGCPPMEIITTCFIILASVSYLQGTRNKILRRGLKIYKSWDPANGKHFLPQLKGLTIPIMYTGTWEKSFQKWVKFCVLNFLNGLWWDWTWFLFIYINLKWYS